MSLEPCWLPAPLLLFCVAFCCASEAPRESPFFSASPAPGWCELPDCGMPCELGCFLLDWLFACSFGMFDNMFFSACIRDFDNDWPLFSEFCDSDCCCA